MRWLVTLAIVLILAAAALSAPWWLPDLLAPLLGDPVLVESATTLAQLVLWVVAGLAGVVGIRWALRQRGPAHRVMEADDLEAAAVQAAAKAEEGADQPATREQEAEVAAAAPEAAEATPGDQAPAISLNESLFGPGGALPPERLRPVGEPEPPPEDRTLSEALFGPGGPLPADSLMPQAGAAAGGLETPAEPVLGDMGQALGEAMLGPDEAHMPGPPEPGAVDPVPPPPEGPRLFTLPADLPDFFGRDAELAQIRRHLGCGPGQVRRKTLAISTVSGMPGVGKTSLVLRLAHALAGEGRFPDAQLYIDLKGSTAHPLAPATALRALLCTVLGPGRAATEDEDTLAHFWRGALQDKRALLVLDDAAGAAQVRPLLPGNPACAVLITSQQRFALPGAGRLDLQPLGQEEAWALLQTLAPRLDDHEADEIASLCGGLPLALRIAGNQLALNDDLDPARYGTHLSNESTRLDLLHDDGEPGLNVADWLAASVSSIPQPMRRSWALLALLPAPFDVSAAAAVWGQGDAWDDWWRLDEGQSLDRLRVLRNRSLLTYDPQANRYGQHVLLRLAAGRELERESAVEGPVLSEAEGPVLSAVEGPVLSEAEGPVLRPVEGPVLSAVEGPVLSAVEGASRRLTYHYLEAAQSADGNQHYKELDGDWPHLQGALVRASQEDVDLFSGLVQSLNNYWSARGMARERVKWNEMVARSLAEAGRQGAVGIHLGDVGAAYDELGQPQQAIEAYGQAIVASRGAGDRDAESAHLQGVGQAYQELGDLKQALNYYQQALDLCRETENKRGEGEVLGCLGSAYSEQGDARRAIGYLQQAVGIAREVGDRRTEGVWLGELAQAYTDLGAVQEAVNTVERALQIARETGDRREEGTHLASLGKAFALQALDSAGAGRAPVDDDWPGEDEDQLTAIRQITVPPPRGIEIFSPEPGRWAPEGAAEALAAMQAPATGGPGQALDGYADLVVQDIWSTTTPLTPGAWTTVSFRLRNLGTASISKRFYIRMWFDHMLVHTWYMDQLLAGGSAVGSVQVRVPDPGSHQIRIHADFTNVVSRTGSVEHIRTENWSWGPESLEPGQVGPQNPLDGPVPGTEEWGQEGQATAIRQIAIPSSRGVDVRSSQEAASSAAKDAVSSAGVDLPPSGPVGQPWDEARSALPAGAIAGAGAEAIDLGTGMSALEQTTAPPPHSMGLGAAGVLAADETGPAAAGLADLAVLRIWSPTRPLVVGDWELLFCRIKNQGAEPVGKRFYTRMWYDHILIRTWYADRLAPNRTAVGSVWVRVADPGRHQIKVQVDVTNAVPETDVTNNVLTETAEWASVESMQAPGPRSPILLAGDEVPAARPLAAPGSDGANGLARELWTQALEIFEEIGDPRSEEVRIWLAELDR